MNMIQQSVRRTSRRGSLQGLQEAAKKAVAFDTSVLVYEDDRFSQEERKDMFYTDDDMDSFRTEIWKFADNHAFSQPMSSTTKSCEEKGDVCMASYTGMEGFLSPEHKSKHKLQGVLSVLMEQERQFKEQGLWTPVDFDSMSHFYHLASQESQEEAHQRALMQRRIVNASLQL